MDARGRRYVAVALTTQAVAIGTTLGSFSLFVQPLQEAFDAARWHISLAPTLIVFALAVGGMTLGPLLDRGAIRPVMLGGSVVLSLSLAVASQATSLGLLAVCCFTAGLAVPALGPMGGSTLVGRVFVEERGRALGIVNLGGPVGIFCFAALAGVALDTLRWHGTLALFAVLALVIPVPLVLRFIPRHVEAVAGTSPEPDAGWTMGRLVRTQAFVLLAGAFAAGMGIAAGWNSQVAVFLYEYGLSVRGAASVVATAAMFAVVGTLSVGILADHVRGERILAGLLSVQFVACVVFVSGAPLAAVVLAILGFGLTTGGFIPVYTTILARRFGPASIGRGMGLTNLFMLPVSAGAGPAAAAVFDVTGNYDGALLAFLAAFGLALFGLAWVARRDRRASGSPGVPGG
ncbi:MAG: MFS transporter [Myxococcota bacterium]|nr:MFS transporter [Myxococcota bacterium]